MSCLVKSLKGKRQTVHDLSLPRCPAVTHAAKTGGKAWAGTVACLQVSPNNGQWPDNQELWPPTCLGVRRQDHPGLDSHRPNLHHFSTALLEFKSHELQLSEFKSLEVHSSEFNSLKIQLHGITQNDRIGWCIVEPFLQGWRFPYRIAGRIEGQGSGKLVNTGSEEVTLKKRNNMSSTWEADNRTASDEKAALSTNIERWQIQKKVFKTRYKRQRPATFQELCYTYAGFKDTMYYQYNHAIPEWSRPDTELFYRYGEVTGVWKHLPFSEILWEQLKIRCRQSIAFQYSWCNNAMISISRFKSIATCYGLNSWIQTEE